MAKGSEVASRAFLKVTNKWSWWQNWVCLLWTKRSTVPASFVLWLEAGLSATNTHVALDWRLKVTHAQMVVFPSQPIIQSVKQSNSPENKHSLGVFPPVLHKHCSYAYQESNKLRMCGFFPVFGNIEQKRTVRVFTQLKEWLILNASGGFQRQIYDGPNTKRVQCIKQKKSTELQVEMLRCRRLFGVKKHLANI